MLQPVSESKGDGGGDAAAGRLTRLPRGRHGLSREFVSQNQRDRITAGIIAAVAENGFHEATISRITTAAGVSRRTFYTYFSSKEECFFDTYDVIADHLRRAAAEAAEPYAEWPERLRARLGAVLDVFAANPDLARFALLVPPRAGEEIAERYRRAMGEVVVELLGDLPDDLDAKRPSRAAEEALVGGGASLIVERVEAGEGESLPDLLPDLLEYALTLFLGRAEAVRIARESPR
jgi:AcrR family transcriptional regulator